LDNTTFSFSPIKIIKRNFKDIYSSGPVITDIDPGALGFKKYKCKKMGQQPQGCRPIPGTSPEKCQHDILYRYRDNDSTRVISLSLVII
jgi:hypothetical protein